MTTVFVVSDLHLGGGDGFRMCERQGQARLATFFEWVAAQAGGAAPVELVLAGDIVDFLAEPDPDGSWSPFAEDEALAAIKLQRILDDTAPVWDGLAACVKGGVRLTLMLGNHDVELSFPKVRRRLLDRLGPGSVEMLFDNEAFTRGKLLVEHGNRYEGWNVVDHDALRRTRSRLSRGEPVGAFPVQPGSMLVARVMNSIKERYAWVDLLKPETSGVVPILALLDTGLWRKAGDAIENAARAAWRQMQFARSGMPTTDGFISETAEVAASPGDPFPDEDVFAWLRERTGEESSFVSDGDRLDVDALFWAMRKWAEKDGRTFFVEREDRRYLKAASTLASRGFQVVVFGHTHHVKRIPLVEPGWGTYLNTGTWADLIRIPEPTLTGSEPEARAAFGRFIDDLANNRLEQLRRLIPTFARIDLDAHGDIARADVYFFDEDATVTPVTTAGLLERLGQG
jgi:UDP-2,3-diacylglucosamine pyrophosphatase LpxH